MDNEWKSIFLDPHNDSYTNVCVRVCVHASQLKLNALFSIVLRKRKVRLGTRTRRRRDGTREHSRCYMASR